MNFQDKSSHPGLDSLRTELAPPELQARIRRALLPNRAKSKRLKVLRVSLGSLVAIGVIGSAILLPRASLASAVRRVLKAFQAIGRYHVKSFEILDGKERLVSETWVNGAKRKFVMYGPDGMPLPNSSAFGDLRARMDQQLRGLTPEQLMDPKLKDRLSGEVKALGPNSGTITFRITVDGQEVKELPEDVKNAIKNGFVSGGTPFNVSSKDDIQDLQRLLKDPTNWEVTSDQLLHGKKVDKYQIRGVDKGVTLLVDPATFLPVSLQMTTSHEGKAVTTRDEIDYPAAGP